MRYKIGIAKVLLLQHRSQPLRDLNFGMLTTDEVQHKRNEFNANARTIKVLLSHEVQISAWVEFQTGME